MTCVIRTCRGEDSGLMAIGIFRRAKNMSYFVYNIIIQGEKW